jgi:hypothetical protein
MEPPKEQLFSIVLEILSFLIPFGRHAPVVKAGYAGSFGCK